MKPIAVVVAGAALVAGACSSSGAAPGTPPSTNARGVVPAVHRTTATLRCNDVVGTSSRPPSGFTVVLHRVALPTRRVLGTSPSGEHDPSAKRFAKQGLLVEPGATFQLVVPDAALGRLTIGWGNPASA